MSKINKKWVYGMLFCLMLCFIWGNSMLSKGISGTISHFIADIFGGEDGASEEGHYLLRKAAHFAEFAALGVISCLLFDSVTQDRWRKCLSIAVVGISVPLIDETIQIFSGRGPALSDVWIDISGFALGSVIMLWVLFSSSKRNKAGR